MKNRERPGRMKTYLRAAILSMIKLGILLKTRWEGGRS